MNETIEKLVDELNSLPDEVFKEEEEDGMLYADDSVDIVKDVERLASDILITDCGQMNLPAIKLLAKYGFHVRKDNSSGWLTGVICYGNNKALVFG